MHDSPEELHRPLHLLFLSSPLGLAAVQSHFDGVQQVRQIYWFGQIIIRPEVHPLAHRARL